MVLNLIPYTNKIFKIFQDFYGSNMINTLAPCLILLYFRLGPVQRPIVSFGAHCVPDVSLTWRPSALNARRVLWTG